MTRRATPPRRPTKTPATAATADLTVVLEDIRAQNRVVIEAVQGVEQRLAGRIDALELKVDREFVAVHNAFAAVDREFVAVHNAFAAVDREFAAVHSELGHIRGGVGHHTHELRDLAALVARKADGASLAALEQRVATIERRGN